MLGRGREKGEVCVYKRLSLRKEGIVKEGEGKGGMGMEGEGKEGWSLKCERRKRDDE